MYALVGKGSHCKVQSAGKSQAKMNNARAAMFQVDHELTQGGDGLEVLWDKSWEQRIHSSLHPIHNPHNTSE